MAMNSGEKKNAISTEQTDADSISNGIILPEERFGGIFSTGAPRRALNFFDLAAAGYNICNSWAGVSATMYVGLLSGGSSTIIYGMLVVAFFTGATVLSLAELAARYPSAGAQYHWTWLLATGRSRRIASYAAAVINIFAWVTSSASICVILPNLIFGVLAMNTDFEAQPWHSFLIYSAMNIVVVAYNIVALPRAKVTHTVGFAVSVLCLLTFWVTCLVKANPKADSVSVWTSFVNEDLGWPSGIVFLIGLSNPNYMYTGIDGALHLAEDALNPVSAVPKALMSTLVIGLVTAFTYVVTLFYCISDPDAVAASPLPMAEIWRQATQSQTAATVMTSAFATIGFFALIACNETASRLTWSFARDNGIAFSGYMGKIHPRLDCPVWALIFNAFVIQVIGFVFLGNPIAFNAIVGTTLILMHISFAIPIAFLMLRGRSSDHLPPKGQWNLGSFGWVANALTIVWAIVVTIFYCFPTTGQPTPETMNYGAVVLGVMAIFGLLNWVFHARHHFRGPRGIQSILGLSPSDDQ